MLNSTPITGMLSRRTLTGLRGGPRQTSGSSDTGKKKKKKSSDYLIYYFCGINLNHENHYNAMFRFVYFKKGEDRYKVKKKKKKD